MFNTPNSGPLAPIVGLERRALEQAGVAPGQEQMAAASKGIPLSSDLAQLIQLNRVLQQRGAAQQQANPTPSTVAQDLKQMAMQQMQQQMPAREQGIANLPVGDLGVRGMAGGGIVAFAGGGDIDAEIKSLEEAIKGDDYIKQGVGGFLGRAISSRTMPMRYADRKQAEQRLAYLKSAANMFAGAPTAVATQPDSNVTYSGPPGRRTSPPSGIRALDVLPTSTPTVGTPAKPRGGGLAEFVPTLTGGAGRISEYDRLLKDMQISNTYTLAERAKEREALEKQYGLDKIRAAREAEMARREKELSPEAQRKAFLNNLSAKLASQIGQRGVSTSTRLAQMLGAYGSTKAETAEQFKKAAQDLNQAKLDVQEKNAIAQMTGALSDRKAAEDAQKQYMDALEKQRTADRLAKQQEATEAHNRAMEKAAMARVGESRTAFEQYGPQLANLDRQIDAMEDKVSAMPSGSAQRTAAEAKLGALKTRRDDMIKRVQSLSPGAYSADVRAAGQDAKRLAEAEKQLNMPQSQYSILGRQADNLRDFGRDSNDKKLTPEQVKSRIAEIEAQRRALRVKAGLEDVINLDEVGQ